MPNPVDPLSRSLSGGPLPDPHVSMALLERAQHGDDKALRDLIERYTDRIRRIARIQLKNSPLRRHCDSMDIVQETYGAALPHLNSFKPQSANGILRWLATVATNKVIDLHEYHGALKRDMARDVPLDEQDDSVNLGAIAYAKGPTPSENASTSELKDIVDDAVAALPDDQQRVVLLRDYCDEDWDTIASDLNRANGAVRMLHQRAKINLRRVLKAKLPSLE